MACAIMKLSIKPEVPNVPLHHQTRTEQRPSVTCTKIGEDWICSSDILSLTKTDVLIAMRCNIYQDQSKNLTLNLFSPIVLHDPLLAIFAYLRATVPILFQTLLAPLFPPLMATIYQDQVQTFFRILHTPFVCTQ